MKVSGFTFVRNAIDLYYPIVESITSILPICDEFVIAAGDSTDGTTELLRRIGDPKIKIIETVWDSTRFVRGASNADQTNIALDACTGDWAFYLQADEVVHERDLPVILEAMRTYLPDPRVEGLLFDYVHLFADYEHYQAAHGWYRREVRAVRTGIGVRSWKSAQGFRRDRQKLHVVLAGARIMHYGWVRPPRQMTRKNIALGTVHQGLQRIQKVAHLDTDYDFGRLWGRKRFTGTHPQVMAKRIAEKNWEVRASTGPSRKRQDQVSNRMLSFIENNVLGFRVGEHRNYILLPS